MPKLVLLVDDNRDIRQFLRFLLEEDGFEVIEAWNGRQAVSMAISERPDLILMDLSMPIMNGMDATREMRQHKHLANIPILALTVYDREFVDEAKAAGCDEVYPKPLDLSMLRPIFREWSN